jgi:alpha-1,3-rhamnosyl/mannosyltransferase
MVASEITDRFAVPPERVVRVYPGVPGTQGGDPASGRRLAGANPYVLFMGTIEPRKNLPVLVRAFDAAAEDDPELALVVAGAAGWGVDAFDESLARAHHRGRVRRLGYVTDGQRRDLLAGAAALAYPSRYEGFGFPPLEAMAAGVPVVAARSGAIPEVVGDAAVLVDPDDVDALAAALLAVVRDPDQRRALVTRGRAQLARFSWARMSDELAALYHRLARA